MRDGISLPIPSYRVSGMLKSSRFVQKWIKKNYGQILGSGLENFQPTLVCECVRITHANKIPSEGN